MKPGDRVTVGGGEPATVVQVGGCDWPKCPDPDTCVRVKEDRYSNTTQYPASSVS